jgi:hypothetical protein
MHSLIATLLKEFRLREGNSNWRASLLGRPLFLSQRSEGYERMEAEGRNLYGVAAFFG